MKKSIILVALIFLGFHTNAQEIDNVKAGKNGIFVHLGLDIPNGKNLSFLIIERKTDGGDWEGIGKLKYPESYDLFKEDLKKYSQLFPYLISVMDTSSVYQALLNTHNLKDTLVPKEAALLAVRLASRNVFFDQDVRKHVFYQYRVSQFSDDQQVGQFISKKIKYPGYTDFANIVVDRILNEDAYTSIRWISVGFQKAYKAVLYHFEDNKAIINLAEVLMYGVGDTTYYLAKIDKQKMQQYFIIPFDYYGKQGNSSQIAYIEKSLSGVNYFQNMKAVNNDDHLQIDLSWILKSKDDILEIDIYRSEDFSGDYKKVGSVSNTANGFSDITISPDKIYYYKLKGHLTFSGQLIETVRFFAYSFEKQAPIPPVIKAVKSEEDKVTLEVISEEEFISGVRIYRKSKNMDDRPELISDLLELTKNKVIFEDTSKIFGGQYYYYYARAENTSHLESDFSKAVEVQSLAKTKSIPLSGLSNFVNSKGDVHLYWDNSIKEHDAYIGYRIYKRKNNLEWKNLLALDSIFTFNRYIDQALEKENLYEYKVCPLDFMFREGTCSFTRVFIHSDDIAPGPNVKLYHTGKGIEILCSDVERDDPIRYRIYRYQRGKNVEMIKELAKSEKSFLDEEVKKDKLYFYYLTSISKDGIESLPGVEASLQL